MNTGTLPPAARAAILAVLPTETDHAAMLPDSLELGRVVFLLDKSKRTREEGLRVKAGQDDAGYFLDFYRVDNDGESTSHGRIRDDGKTEQLENFEGEFGRKVFPDPADTKREDDRINAHNARVRAILTKKGFV